MKLKKYLRFSKCPTCEKLRAARWARTSSRVEKEEAMAKLIDHYHHVKRERAYAMHKAQQAIERPMEVLSIAIDGTDQVC